MRVAVDCHMVGQPQAGDAGNARFHTLLANALQATAVAGDAVTALIAHPAARELIDAGIATTTVRAANVRRLAWDIPRALARDGSDVALFSYITPPRSPCPTVVVVHDVSFKLHPRWFSRRDRALLGALVPRAMRRASIVVTVSERSKADLLDVFNVDPDRVRVIHNVPAPTFAPREGARERVARRFALDRYCLFVGDVHPRKNLGSLTDAVRSLGDPTLELAVVGRAGHRGREIIAASGARWLGPLGDTDLADLYAASAVTCYPSLYEGFGLPVVEAMACGAPVVASDRGAIPEVAGDAALLVAPTPAALADGIRAALEPATAARLRAAGPLRAARFTPAAMGTTAWSVLREAAR